MEHFLLLLTCRPFFLLSLLFYLFLTVGVDQDDVVQFLSRLGVEAVETPIGAFNELYRCEWQAFLARIYS